VGDECAWTWAGGPSAAVGRGAGAAAEGAAAEGAAAATGACMDDGPGPAALVGEDEDVVRAFLRVRLTSGEAWRFEDMLCC
jgi:hypothetical protein